MAPTNASARDNGTGVQLTEIRVRGKNHIVPSARIGDRLIVMTSRFPRLASIKDEDFQQGEFTADPERISEAMKQAGVTADLFTFAQKFPDLTPKFDLHMEWDNVAAIETSSYSNWWDRQISSKLRKNLRRSYRAGVTVEEIEPDDEFVDSLIRIYNETPIRQGRPFWHYGKSRERVKEEVRTYLDRSLFLAAFCDQVMIGFMKVVFVDRIARMMHIITMLSHKEKNPANALIAKAVEICEREKCTHLTYGRYVYGKNRNSSLTEFKSRNGFRQFMLPRYYMPLTAAGRIAIKLNLHKGLTGILPESLTMLLLNARAKYYQASRKMTSAEES